MTEWTGYVFAAGMMVLLWSGWLGVMRNRRLALRLGAVTALSAMAIFAHFALVLGIRPTLRAFMYRSIARSARQGAFLSLVSGYWLSFGVFAVVVILLLIWFAHHAYRNAKGKKTDLALGCFFLVGVASLPLLENILMMQHASEYTYDRLKFVFPAALIVAIAFANLRVMGRIALSLSLLICCVTGFFMYKSDLRSYASWTEIDLANRRMAEEVQRYVDPQCAIFASSLATRGYANLLVHHGIYELTNLTFAKTMDTKRHGCGVVFMEGSYPLDMPKYEKITVLHNDGSAVLITPVGVVARMGSESEGLGQITEKPQVQFRTSTRPRRMSRP